MPEVEGKKILNGIDLDIKAGEVHAIMGPNGSGKSTLICCDCRTSRLFNYQRNYMILDGIDISKLDAEERAHRGIFYLFSIPVEIPGVSVTNFIKTAINESRKSQGLMICQVNMMLKKIREKSKLLEIDSRFFSRSLNQGFSGGEKKA